MPKRSKKKLAIILVISCALLCIVAFIASNVSISQPQEADTGSGNDEYRGERAAVADRMVAAENYTTDTVLPKAPAGRTSPGRWAKNNGFTVNHP